jgi:serine/threonine protein kinase
MSRQGLAPGDILRKRYRITRELGRGAYSCVYLAEDMADPRARWAIKELIEESMESDERREVVELFRREAQLLRMLSHRQIPGMADLFTEGSHHYLVMEYIDGETLQDIMDKKPPESREVLSWALQICTILHFIHGMNIIFRDIKPSNIMKTQDDRLLLVDYGIARFYSRESSVDTHRLGTPGFAPPEQYGKGQSDQRSDIYALGATVYYLLTGADIAPFNFIFPPLRSLKPEMPHELENILKKCLEPDPDARYQRIDELKPDLEACRMLLDAPPAPSKASPPPPQAPVKKASPLRILASSPSVIALLFFMTIYFTAMHVQHRFYDGTRITSANEFYTWLPLVDGLMEIFRFFAIILFITTIITANILGPMATRKEIPEKLSGFIFMGAWITGIILVGIFLPNEHDYSTLKCEHNMMRIGKALQSYRAQHGRYPSSLPEDALRKIRCPAAKTQNYLYSVNEKAGRYTAWCSGSNHLGDPKWTRSPAYKTGANFPQYSSVFGLLHRGHGAEAPSTGGAPADEL